MPRTITFAPHEFYHIYNRGIDKRTVFEDQYDFTRFLECMDLFNTIEPIGSIYEHSFLEKKSTSVKRLVRFIAYCLNPNHFHFILEQLEDEGIPLFMQRLGGYTKYFNQKNKRSGSLFQGVFKAKHIDTNEYLLHLSAYVNLNFKIHGLGSEVSKSSWEFYSSERTAPDFVSTEIILEQFDSKKSYGLFATEAAELTIEKRKEDELFDALFFKNEELD